ncbi:MAG: class I SAM-dependent methyltransferase [Bryobacteraceae bacterium]|nr:class I SAM-dependent methyltransferase [Bryobacteraceae bacterium]
MSPDMLASLNFGYPWWLSYGHLALATVTGALLLFGYWRNWSRWLLIVLGAGTLWAGSAFLLIRFAVNVDSIAAMPTQNFLRSGTGKVLDLGAGTGRSSIMFLSARPAARLVALDLFGESFDTHFGHGTTPQERLLANLKAAGLDNRASIVTGDMRKLPFEDGTFDGIISSYAVDHLGRDGVKETLAEASRVLKPGGEFLLVLINGHDPWLQFAFGPLLAHGGFRGTPWWETRLQESGLRVTEKGTAPASFYLVSRR